MTEKVSVVFCTCELDNGYIFKNYFNFNSLRGRPVITFTADEIVSNNRTADDQLYGASNLNGDEINLIWDSNIPVEQRKVSLTFDAARIQTTFGRIRKKDQARIAIAQLRNANDPYNFCGASSSDDFIIYVSCGTGGDGREGLRSIPATRVKPEPTMIMHPQKLISSMLVIPIRSFRQMIDSFGKCKKESIRLCFYSNSEVKGRPGILLSTDAGGIIEKFGEVPEDDNNSNTKNWSAPTLSNLKIDETAVVRVNSPPQIVFEVEKPPEPNEFIFNADKVSIFARLASMHNEGNVRIEYQPGCHLRIAHRFGAFGECELYMHNKHVKFSK